MRNATLMRNPDVEIQITQRCNICTITIIVLFVDSFIKKFSGWSSNNDFFYMKASTKGDVMEEIQVFVQQMNQLFFSVIRGSLDVIFFFQG